MVVCVCGCVDVLVSLCVVCMCILMCVHVELRAACEGASVHVQSRAMCMNMHVCVFTLSVRHNPSFNYDNPLKTKSDPPQTKPTAT